MKVADAIKERRSIRRFLDEDVTSDELNKLLEAARLAPSGLNVQPWRFKLLLGKENISWLAREAVRGQRWVGGSKAVIVCCADLGSFTEDVEKNFRILRDSGILPPEMVAGVQEFVEKTGGYSPEMLRYAAATNCSIAITQMMLQAVELGLGTCWIGMYDEEAVKQKCGIGDDFAVVALLAVGRPAENPAPRPRKSMEEIVLP